MTQSTDSEDMTRMGRQGSREGTQDVGSGPERDAYLRRMSLVRT
jgi:hypothetical protein